MITNGIDYQVGKYLIVWITGNIRKHIAEVVGVEPLRLKVAESGPFASLRAGDFIVSTIDTLEFQEDERECRCDWLQNELANGCPPASGLASLGVTDTSGKLYEIIPSEMFEVFLKTTFAFRYFQAGVAIFAGISIKEGRLN